MPSVPRAPDAPPPARRKSRLEASSISTAAKRKILQLFLMFVTCVLVINALVGERGLMETLRARRQHEALVASIERLRAENARMREEARRLLYDPATIEALARQELGLIRPGEMLFIIRDHKPAPASGR